MDGVKIGFYVPVEVRKRCEEVADVTGQTLTSVFQMALAVGLSNIEPQVYGSMKKQAEATSQMAEVFAIFTKSLSEDIKTLSAEKAHVVAVEDTQ